MPDSLGLILDGDNPENNDTLNITNDDLILEIVERNMTEIGYTRIDTIDEFNQPDVVLFSQVLVVKNTSTSYYPTYPWFGYGGYYWPYYGYGYGWSYTPVMYSYSTGTIILEMVDYKSIDVENKILNVVWAAGVDGLMRDSQSTNEQVITYLFDHAFNN